MQQDLKTLYCAWDNSTRQKYSLDALENIYGIMDAESIWIENNVFGPNVVQSVLGGTHYVRYFLLCETMERLQWSAFFKTQEPETYKEELLTLKRLQDSIAEKDADRSRELLEEFSKSNSYANMIESFQKLKNEGCMLSETFQYWDGFIALVAILRNLVRTDRGSL